MITIGVVSVITCFGLIIIFMLLVSFGRMRQSGKQCENQNFRVLNLQVVMITLVLVAGLGLFVGNVMTKYKWQATIAIITCSLITCAMVIGLYTINLFATKPFKKKQPSPNHSQNMNRSSHLNRESLLKDRDGGEKSNVRDSEKMMCVSEVLDETIRDESENFGASYDSRGTFSQLALTDEETRLQRTIMKNLAIGGSQVRVARKIVMDEDETLLNRHSFMGAGD